MPPALAFNNGMPFPQEAPAATDLIKSAKQYLWGMDSDDSEIIQQSKAGFSNGIINLICGRKVSESVAPKGPTLTNYYQLGPKEVLPTMPTETMEASFELNSAGVITRRKATVRDIPSITELYHKVHMHTENIEELLDPDSPKSYKKVGAMINIPSPEELTYLIDNGLLLVIEKDKKVIAAFSCYTVNLYNDLLRAFQQSSNTDDNVFIEKLSSLENIETVENSSMLINREFLASMLKEAEKKEGKIFWALDVLVDPKFQKMGIASFLERQIYIILRELYNCLFFLDDIYDIKYGTINGKPICDDDNKPIAMENEQGKRLHRDAMGAIEIGTKEGFTKTIGQGSDKSKSAQIYINPGVWAFCIEKALTDPKLTEKYINNIHTL